jgi:hypothetical protein
MGLDHLDRVPGVLLDHSPLLFVELECHGPASLGTV